MMDIGRVVVKTKGKDAGRVAVIVDVMGGNMVMIDGNVKRKRCNMHHLEPMSQKLEIKKGAGTEEVKKILDGHNLLEKQRVKKAMKRKERKKAPRPVHIRKKKEAPAPKEKGKKAKKEPKKSEDEMVEEALAKV